MCASSGILVDSSALVNIIKRGELYKLRNAVVLDLTLYEALNAVWKEHYLLKRIDLNTASRLAKIIATVYMAIDKRSIAGLEEEVFKLSSQRGLTIYDASYVVLAQKESLVLVTDDRKLASRARDIVRIKTSREI